MNFFHQLFNPHCPHCISERECRTCDVLKTELARVQRENELLLAKLLDKPAPVEEVKVESEGSKQIGKPYISWTARRQMLEAESREAARIIEERKSEIIGNTKSMTVEELEKQLEVK